MREIQCEVCVCYGRGPETVGSNEVVWICENCGARHMVSMWGGTLQSKRLLDLVRVPPALRLSTAVRRDLSEAATALNARAPRASAVMMRRALERRLVELGASNGTLHKKIKALGDAGKLDEITVGGATAIRFFGNYGAHPSDDLLDEVDIARAQRAFDLVAEIMRQLGAQ